MAQPTTEAGSSMLAEEANQTLLHRYETIQEQNANLECPDDVIESLGFIDPKVIEAADDKYLAQLRTLALSLGVFIAKGLEWPIRRSFKDLIEYANDATKELPACMTPPRGEEIQTIEDLPYWRKQARFQLGKIGPPGISEASLRAPEQTRAAEEKMERKWEQAQSLHGSAARRLSTVSFGERVSQGSALADTSETSPAPEEREARGPVVTEDEFSKNDHWISRAIQTAYKFPNNTAWDVNSDKDLVEVISVFEKNMRVAKVPKSAYVEALSLWLRDGASLFYLDNIDGKINDYDEAVELLMKQYYDQPTRDRYLKEWVSLSYSRFRKAAPDDWTALSNLYTRVRQLQRILGAKYKDEEFAIQQLKMAMRDTDAYKSISTQHFESTNGLMSALRNALENHPTSASSTAEIALADVGDNPTAEIALANIGGNQNTKLPPYGNQKYQQPYRPRPNHGQGNRTNPKGRDGKPLRCLVCQSEHHLLAACGKSADTRLSGTP